ncbi:MAG: alpha/beta hydrolase [Labilithrix sp.]|nr:alpha/beta hydrolase [Labilithrix sp.]MCW5810815.1 alpha/beta hydrolase [Labilithrix sp.]
MLRLLRLFLAAFWQTLKRRRTRGPARPSWSFSFECVVAFLRLDWEESSTWPLPRVRAVTDARPIPQDQVKKTATRDGTLAGLRTRWFVPPGARDDGALLFFHGGSYAFGSAWTTHADVIARLALASGVTAIAVDYRLAPEDPFPAAHEDAITAFDALVADGMKADRIVVGGDSAGGNLALELQLALRDRGGPQAKGALLLSPWADLEMPGASFLDNDPYDFGDRKTLVAQAKAYAGEVPLSDPRLSPVNASFAGLAPAFVSAGECEIPRDDILRLAARMKDDGVDVTLDVAPDMPHDPAVFAQYHPNGEAALQAAARWIKAQLPAPR